MIDFLFSFPICSIRKLLDKLRGGTCPFFLTELMLFSPNKQENVDRQNFFGSLHFQSNLKNSAEKILTNFILMVMVTFIQSDWKGNHHVHRRFHPSTSTMSSSVIIISILITIIQGSCDDNTS